MKKIEFDLYPRPLLGNALPWLLARFSMSVKCAIIGMWEFGFPDEYNDVVIESQEQCKDFFQRICLGGSYLLPRLD